MPRTPICHCPQPPSGEPLHGHFVKKIKTNPIPRNPFSPNKVLPKKSRALC